MTAMTFESINYSPRRAAVRRNARPAVRVVAPTALPTSAAIRPSYKARGLRQKAGLVALAAVTLLLHAGVISALKHSGPAQPLPPKVEPLAIQIAPPPPPPPPPPPEPPKPQLAKVTPVRVIAPSTPVVRQAPVDNGPPTADTVQVATAAPVAPVPVAAPPAPPPPEPVTEPRGFVGYRSNPAPDYPAFAQDRGLQGKVVLKVQVLASGRAGQVTVDKSSGHKVLDDAAIKAVLAWAFDPARRGQTPIDGWVSVPLNFKLS
ncbi:MAG: TonB family protein [Pseudomonadota bacterium]